MPSLELIPMSIGLPWILHVIYQYLNGRQRGRSDQGRACRRLRYRPDLETLEDLTLLSTLDIVGGVLTYTAGNNVNNNVTVQAPGPGTQFTLNDTAETITVSAAAAAAGFTGNGTNTVTGPETSPSFTSIALNLGNGTDTLTLGPIVSAISPLSATDGGTAGDTVTIANTVNVAGNLALSGFTTINVNGALTTTNSGTVSLSAATAGATIGQINVTNTMMAAGAVSLTADNMNLGSSINAGANIVTLSAASAGQVIDLGGTDSAGTLGLTDAELGQITASLLRVGSLSNTGGIQVSAAAIGTTNAANYSSTLSLLSSGGIREIGVGSLGTPGTPLQNLALQTNAGQVTLTNAINTVAQIAANISSAFNTTFLDGLSLNVGTVDSVSGFTGTGGVTLQSSAAGTTLTVSQAISSTNKLITLTFDDMAINALVNSGNSNVLLRAFSAARPISLGTNAANQLGLTDAELTNVQAAQLIIGATTQIGAINLNGQITAHSSYNTLVLLTNNAIVDNNNIEPDLAVTNLFLRAASGIAANLAVTNLAFNNTTSAAVTLTNAGNLTITNVAGSGTSTTAGGAVSVTALGAGSLLSVGSPGIDTTNGGAVPGGANITLTADHMAINASLNAGTSAPQVTATSLLIDYTSGATLPQGLTFNGTAAGGPLTLSDQNGSAAHTYGVNTGSNHQIVRDGAAPVTWNANITNVTVTGGSLSDTFNVTPDASDDFAVNGGNPVPPAAPGDTLNLNLAGTSNPALSSTLTSSGYQGTRTFGNAQNVNFTQMETLNPNPLTITKTDGQTATMRGGTVTYTITVTNSGANAIPSATVTDMFPAATFSSASYTSVASGGATGNTASGTGNISDTVTMPVGSSITYTVTATVSPTASGSVSNTATASDGTNTASAIDADSLLTITKTDGVATVIPGLSTTYTITVANSGPNTIASASVTDMLPAGISGDTFTSTTTGGATGNTASGSGNISDTVTLPAGSTITYTVIARTATSARGTLVNTASVTGSGATVSATAAITLTPINYFAVGTGQGGAPEVKVFNAATGALLFDFFAYNPVFTGGVRVAVGDVNGDGIPDIITAPGPGGGPLVNVFNGKDLSLLLSFNAYDPAFLGGLFVAAGDVNGDGPAEIITAPDAGGGPLVKVFNGTDASLRLAFNAYTPAFLGGVHVAAGDLNGDGRAEIITAPGFGGGPLVQAFDGKTAALLIAFDAYAPAFIGGVFVAAGDINGDGKAEIITGANGAPQVNVFNSATGSLQQSYFAFDATFTGGVRVAATVVNGKPAIVAGEGPGGLPEVRIQDALTLAVLDDFFAYDPLFQGGVFVGGV
jgi:uncharacterized repeat protein (TIGR01451 family)